MTGKADAPRHCPLCGGQLADGTATIPFVLGDGVAIIKQVPAEVCDTCGEPFLHAAAADVVTSLLEKARDSSVEVAVMTYPGNVSAAA